MENLFEHLVKKGSLQGQIGEKRLFILKLHDLPGYMVALENDGCYVVEDISKPVFATDLMGAGFDFLTAPAVATVIEEFRKWLVEPNGSADALLIGEAKHD